jgi:hypothetical protein
MNVLKRQHQLKMTRTMRHAHATGSDFPRMLSCPLVSRSGCPAGCVATQRYFKRGDVYVHADLHGASSTIVKNPHPDQPIPPLTLQEVTVFLSVCLPAMVVPPCLHACSASCGLNKQLQECCSHDSIELMLVPIVWPCVDIHGSGCALLLCVTGWLCLCVPVTRVGLEDRDVSLVGPPSPGGWVTG